MLCVKFFYEIMSFAASSIRPMTKAASWMSTVLIYQGEMGFKGLYEIPGLNDMGFCEAGIPHPFHLQLVIPVAAS